MAIQIGTSGWQYRHWRETFYPRGMPQGEWLEYYAARFCTVESNYAFYRLPEGRSFASWARRTPDDFVMAVKVSRYITHIKKLAESGAPVRQYLERAVNLGPKLGPSLLQLPPTLGAHPERLTATLGSFPPGFRVAVEFRHATWFTPETEAILRDHGAALCLTDRGGTRSDVWRTADWTYLRFHGGMGSPPGCYGSQELADWAARLADGWGPDADVFVYFNNDWHACALRDAHVFAEACDRAGLRPSRVAPPEDVRLG